MSDAKSVYELNHEVADKINEEVLNDSQSPLRGKFVGIVDGQVVAVGDMDEVLERLGQIKVDPNRTFCFEAGRDYSQVEEIWGLR